MGVGWSHGNIGVRGLADGRVRIAKRGGVKDTTME